MRKKLIFTGVLWCVLLAVVLWLLNALFMPKYMSEIPEGALIAEYYNETADHDVVFIGDCEVYENFSPDVLWREYGITSYIRGSAQQLIWQSYYLMEETLKYETPKVMVFNVLSMQYGEPQSEAYNRLNLDGMRLSPQKLAAVEASMTEEESMLSYLFPLLRYHTRWSELTAEDVKYMFHRDPVSDSGYLMNVEVRRRRTCLRARPWPTTSLRRSATTIWTKWWNCAKITVWSWCSSRPPASTPTGTTSGRSRWRTTPPRRA